MKNILYLLIIVGLGVMMGFSETGYVIRGKVIGTSEGRVYITGSGNASDTIVSMVFKNGTFELKGKCDGVIPASIYVEAVVDGEFRGMKPLPIYLENKQYTVTFDLGDVSSGEVKGGGESQKLANTYTAMERDENEGVKRLRGKFQTENFRPDQPEFKRYRALTDSIRENGIKKREEFLKQHATSYFVLNELARTASRLSLDELEREFKVFDIEKQQSYSGRIVSGWIAKLKSLSPGHIAPDFTVCSPQGESFTLYSVKAKAKLIDFWASWCGPCRALTPDLIEIYNDFHSKGLEIIGISFDDRKSNWVKAIEEEKMPWIHGSDLKGHKPNNPLQQAYVISGIPHLILMDENNQIVANNLRGEELRKTIANILDK